MSCSIRISVTSAGSAEQQLREPLALAAREPRGRLVEQHQPSARRRSPSRPRAVAARRGRDRADACRELVAESDALGRLARPLAQHPGRCCSGYAQAAAVVGRRSRDRCCPRPTARERAASSGTCARGRASGRSARAAGDVLAEHLDRAGRGREVARDEIEERRLPGAVRAEDRTALAVRDVEIDVAHGLNTAEAPADPPQAEDRLGARGVAAWSPPAT